MENRNNYYCPAYEGLFHCCSILKKIVNLDQRKMRQFARESKSLILRVEKSLSFLESRLSSMRTVDRESRPDDGVELFGDFKPPCPFDEYRKQTCESIRISSNKLSTSKILARGRQIRSGATGTATPSALKYKKNYTKKISSGSYNDIRKNINESLHEVSDDFIDLEEYECPVEPFTETNEPDGAGDMMVSSASLSADFSQTTDSPKDSNEKEETTRTTGHTSHYEEITGSYSNGLPQNSIKQLSVRPKNSNITKGLTGRVSDDTNLARPRSYEINTGRSATVIPDNQYRSGAARTSSIKYKKVDPELLKNALLEFYEMRIEEYSNDSNQNQDSAVSTVERVAETMNPNLIGEASGGSFYVDPQNLDGATNPVTLTRNYSNGLPQTLDELRLSLEPLIEVDFSLEEDDEVV